MHDSSHSSALPSLNAFLRLMSKVRSHARFAFRGVRCTTRKEEVAQEAVALAWKWFARLHERGKDVSQFETAFVVLVVRAVCAGRRLCGHEKTRDVLSPVAQRRHGFRVDSLSATAQPLLGRCPSRVDSRSEAATLAERLSDNPRTPVPDQAAFRVDFAHWRETLREFDRRILDRLMRDERTMDVALAFRLSPARISQLRRRYAASWDAFCGEPANSHNRQQASA